MKKLTFLIGIFLGGALILQLGGTFSPPLAHAVNPQVSGFAWSSTIGWICFYDATSCSTANITVDASNNLTGYAWSSNVGWIQFGGLAGFPSGSGTTASNAKISSGQVVGWAKVVNAGTSINVSHNDVFSDPGVPASFVVPAGVTSITVKIWGAGGGGGGSGSASVGGDGAGGGYVGGTITVTPGETLTVTAGDGGNAGVAATATAFGGTGGNPGGGNGGKSRGGSGDRSGTGGGGGGYSSLYRASTPLMIAAGGGGGGGGEDSAGVIGSDAGPGGGVSGIAGTNAGSAGAGQGGTSSAGGAAGTPGTVGQAGSSLNGGNAADNSASLLRGAGGGGGAGYYGGGSGAGSTSGSSAGAGGGGGSSYIAAGITGTSNMGGSGATAGNYSDPSNTGQWGAGGLGGILTSSHGGGTITGGDYGNGGVVIISYNTTENSGWDGWISFKGTNYTTTVTGADLSGYAWGGDIVGWISFNCSNTSTCGTSNYKTSILNYLPVVTVVANGNAAEPSPVVTNTYTITRTGSTAASMDVNFSVSGAAARNTDYSLSGNGVAVPSGTTVTIPAGSASTNITLTPIDDPTVEGNEIATLALAANAAVYTVGSPSSADMTIIDNDCASGFTWNGTSCVVSNPAITSFTASPTRVRPNTSTTLSWNISNFSAGLCSITSSPSGLLSPYPYSISAASGNAITSPITQTTEFKLNCGSGVYQTRTVTIIPTIQEI